MNDNLTDISMAAYLDIRNYITTNWLGIELLNASGESILKITTADNRLEWVVDEESNIISMNLTINGSDAELAPLLPVTISRSRILKGNAVMDDKVLPYENFILPLPASQLNLSHQIEMPYVVVDTEETP
jgi:hypothetical protein